MQTEIKQTHLYGWHRNAGAKFTPFAGWDMPVVYSGIVQEHMAVRNSAGLFDISHMGQIFAEGAGALDFPQKICTNDVSKCKPGYGMYSHMCKEDGGVIDDIFVYFLQPQKYLIVVNAATVDKDFEWMRRNNLPGVELSNRSDAFGMIALQGPSAQKIMGKLSSALPVRNQIAEVRISGVPVYLCRTGYTGEDGFELIVPSESSLKIWEAAMEVGKEFGLQPCGLGARDTLRLEAGFLLYGSDVDEEHTSVESGPAWVVKLDKTDFIGRSALARQKESGPARKLAAFKLTERGIPRHGSKIFCSGKEAGAVTSGTFSPMLQRGIAMGYIPSDAAGAFAIECGAKQVSAQLAALPFYKK